MLGRLNHVALAVPDLAAASRRYREVLGASVSEPRAIPAQGVTVAFVELPNTRLELMEPLGDASPIAKFLVRHPKGGIHHLCFEVDDVRAAAARLAKRGVRILGSAEPRPGAHGTPVIFLDPAEFAGALIELEQTEAAE